MIPPPLGFCLSARFVTLRDADTLILALRTGNHVAVRLIGINAPELDTPAGVISATFVQGFLEALPKELDKEWERLRVWFPPPIDRDHNGIIDIPDLLKGFSFDRIPGRVYAKPATEEWVDLSELLIENKLAKPFRKDIRPLSRMNPEWVREYFSQNEGV